MPSGIVRQEMLDTQPPSRIIPHQWRQKHPAAPVGRFLPRDWPFGPITAGGCFARRTGLVTAAGRLRKISTGRCREGVLLLAQSRTSLV
jgi:hypothetical protein